VVEARPNGVLVALDVVETDDAIPIFWQLVLGSFRAWCLHVDHDANLPPMDWYPVLQIARAEPCVLDPGTQQKRCFHWLVLRTRRPFSAARLSCEKLSQPMPSASDGVRSGEVDDYVRTRSHEASVPGVDERGDPITLSRVHGLHPKLLRRNMVLGGIEAPRLEAFLPLTWHVADPLVVGHPVLESIASLSAIP